MTTQKSLYIAGLVTSPEIEISPKGYEQRNEILSLAKKINKESSHDDAATALRAVEIFSRIIESQRKDCNKPLLAATKKINSTAKEFMQPLLAESDRIETIVSDNLKAEQALRESMSEELVKMMQDGEQPEKVEEKAMSLASSFYEAGTSDGVHLRRSVDFEVLDAAALAFAHPELVTITPKKLEILDWRKKNKSELPGVRFFEKEIVAVKK